MRKRLLILFLLLPLVGVSIVIPQRASADTPAVGSSNYYGDQGGCGNNYLNEWNWPQNIQNYNGGNNIGFDYNNDSYVIYKPVNEGQYTDTDGSTAPRNYYYMVIDSAPDKMTVSYDGTKAILHYTGQVYILEDLNSEPANENKVWADEWHGFGNGNGLFTTGYSLGTSGEFDLSLDSIQCVDAAHNVNYDSSWPFAEWDSSQSYGTGNGKVACKLTDVTCIISQAYNSIESAFQAVGMAIVEAVAYLFVPDSQQLQNLWQDFNNFLQQKLGFLLYPFQWLGQVFDAFTSSSSWCGSTSCVQNFGNFMGSNFSLNLAQLNITMPTLWTWFCNAVRGITILLLIIAVRGKLRGVTNK